MSPNRITYLSRAAGELWGLSTFVEVTLPQQSAHRGIHLLGTGNPGEMLLESGRICVGDLVSFATLLPLCLLSLVLLAVLPVGLGLHIALPLCHFGLPALLYVDVTRLCCAWLRKRVLQHFSAPRISRVAAPWLLTLVRLRRLCQHQHKMYRIGLLWGLGCHGFWPLG